MGRSGGCWKPGEKHPNARLKDADVLEIRRLYFETDITQQKLADKYGVSQSHVGKIINNISWKHIGGRK